MEPKPEYVTKKLTSGGAVIELFDALRFRDSCTVCLGTGRGWKEKDFDGTFANPQLCGCAVHAHEILNRCQKQYTRAQDLKRILEIKEESRYMYINPMRLTTSEAILIFRRRLKWTQTELGKIAGVCKNTVRSIERNQVNPTPETLDLIWRALRNGDPVHED